MPTIETTDGYGPCPTPLSRNGCFWREDGRRRSVNIAILPGGKNPTDPPTLHETAIAQNAAGAPPYARVLIAGLIDSEVELCCVPPKERNRGKKTEQNPRSADEKKS
mmetsp:Transcript_58096/g.173383  ORF Transcript_58096/g.173383 Transcript_58096/m.173383 type:complete len:107 (-) Transcript_58096:331-651(-)